MIIHYASLNSHCIVKARRKKKLLSSAQSGWARLGSGSAWVGLGSAWLCQALLISALPCAGLIGPALRGSARIVLGSSLLCLSPLATPLIVFALDLAFAECILPEGTGIDR